VRRTVVVLGLVMLAVPITLLGARLLHNRVVFGQWLGSGPPPRIDWCGRRYYRSDSPALTLTMAQVRQRPPVVDPLVRVVITPSGMPVLARVMSRSKRKTYDTQVCAVILYVEVHHDAYMEYALSGGP
jgi:hypothetical protein